MNTPKLVFIVEDNPAHQKMLQVHFEQMLGNYQVKTFDTPDAMMAELETKPFAIVLDHYFPKGKTGMEYLRQIKKKHRSIPVIYYTTATDEKIREEAKNAGADDYIVKDEASLVRLRTALDQIAEASSKKGFFKKLFG